MQSALDKANKASEEKDVAISSLRQQLGEMEERLVGGDDVYIRCKPIVVI